MEVLGPNLSREKKKLRTSREILSSVNLEQSDLVFWCAVFIKLYFNISFPGRLDRKIELPNPDQEARARIMQIHSRKMNVRLVNISSDTRGQYLHRIP